MLFRGAGLVLSGAGPSFRGAVRVQRGRYGNASEYLRDLIRQDQSREAERLLEEMLIAGLAPDRSDWDDERPDFQKIAKLLQEKK